MPTQRRTPSLMSQSGSSPNRYSSSNLFYNPQGRIPLRSTLKTEKLVLIPEEDEGNRYKARTGVTTNAELNKDQRSQVPRVTSYCIAKHFDLDKIQAFVKHSHGIKSRRFDECLYFSYDELSKEMLFGKPNSIIPVPFGIMGTSYNTNENSLSPNSKSLPQRIGDYRNPRPEFTTRGEAFIFDYGVIVLWNFTLDEEAEFISHLSPYGSEYLDESDICIEDLHFQYDDGGPVAPKVYNDMITLKGNSPLIKLTISHGISQSVMLSLFENIMGCAIEGNCPLLDAAPLPHMLAKEGDVFMDRVEIMKTIGKLYDLKMNVNLISSVLGLVYLTRYPGDDLV